MAKIKSTQAQVAQIIRKWLKANYKGIKFTVRSDSGSMTTSVSVSMNNVDPKTHDEISSYINQFQYGSFDGMTDSYNYDNRREDIPQVRWVSSNNNFDDEYLEASKLLVLEKYGNDLNDYELNRYIYSVLNDQENWNENGFKGLKLFNALEIQEDEVEEILERLDESIESTELEYEEENELQKLISTLNDCVDKLNSNDFIQEVIKGKDNSLKIISSFIKAERELKETIKTLKYSEL
jgi:hypothetical protein